jgi:hypothetical protein
LEKSFQLSSLPSCIQKTYGIIGWGTEDEEIDLTASSGWADVPYRFKRHMTCF